MMITIPTGQRRVARRKWMWLSQSLFLVVIIATCILLPGISSLANSAQSTKSSLVARELQPPVPQNKHKNQADTRPHEQRANGPRQARRLNHAFKYLYRHDNDNNYDKVTNLKSMTSYDYLAQYFTNDEIITMNQTFPPLLELNVSRHLHPKMRFLQETMGLYPANISKSSSEQQQQQPSSFLIPPQYFGARLERTIAPRHAFLVYQGLPHGPELMEQDGSQWKEFLKACRNIKQFSALCNHWKRKNRLLLETQQQQQQSSLQKPSPPSSSVIPSSTTSSNSESSTNLITSKQIEAFDAMFGRGALAAARNEIVQSNNTWPLQYTNISSSQILRLLIQHGANPLERDNRGVSLLHWASGTGNLPAVHELLSYYFETESHMGVMERAQRDGATPLHWAAAGATGRAFGTGGHVDVCRYLIDACASTATGNLRTVLEDDDDDEEHSAAVAIPPLPVFPSMAQNQQTMVKKKKKTTTVTIPSAKELVNALTYDGNSALMWASWSGTLETVKLLIRNRADACVANRNGCTVAHWAASGGNVDVCEYLATIVGVDFFQPNHGGNTPLTHAVAFGRLDVAQWLKRYQQQKVFLGGDGGDVQSLLEEDEMAANLAQDFVGWKSDDTTRKQILQLFHDDFWNDATIDGGTGNDYVDKGDASTINLQQEYQELI